MFDLRRLIGTTPEGTVVGYLQYGEVNATSDSSTLNEQAAARKQRQSATRHSLIGTSTALGAQVQIKSEELDKINRLVEQEPLPSYRDEGRLWKLFTHVNPATMSTGAQWQLPFPAEWHHLQKSLGRFVQYRKPIDMTGEEWDDYRDQITQLKADLLKALQNQGGPVNTNNGKKPVLPRARGGYDVAAIEQERRKTGGRLNAERAAIILANLK